MKKNLTRIHLSAGAVFSLLCVGITPAANAATNYCATDLGTLGGKESYA